MKQGEAPADCDDIAAIEGDLLAVDRIDAVPTLLQVLCESTGMRFAAVARVTERSWTACAVHDEMQFGLKAGGQLDVRTTFCRDVRSTRNPIVIDHVSQDPLYRTHRTPKEYGFESYVSVPIILRSGEYFGNLCAIDPLPRKVSDGRTVSMFKRFAQLIADQLDMKRMHAKVRATLHDEREIGELRELFVALLGHELRVPIGRIEASGRELAKKVWDPALVEVAARLRNDARRMSTLIDDVLDFAQARFGNGIAVRMQQVADLAEPFNAAVSDLTQRNASRKIIANLAAGVGLWCDPVRMRQLAHNLIENALTHGLPYGPVSFVTGVDGDSLVIEVWNDGTPIPAHQIPHIFMPYWRPSVGAGRAGIGLGLHICWQIVRAHHGDIAVTSSKKNGTQFIVRLPLAADRPATATHPPVRINQRRGEQA